MSVDVSLFALLHVLVFVYWLGGDLGAFYTSRFLTAPDVSADHRMMAAKIVGDVDMAPRTALILTLPTGVLLAVSKGWLNWPMALAWGILIASLAWLALAWYLHMKHGSAAKGLARLDLAIRFVLVIGLLGFAVAALAGHIALPFFLILKICLLAAAIIMGLLIRIVLRPLGPALMGLSGDNAAAAEQSLATTLRRARPLVMVIWVIIISAAFVGLWTPSAL